MDLKQKKPIKALRNPLLEDFTVMWAGDTNIPQSYTIPAKQIKSFPIPIANHILKHLAEAVYQFRGQKLNHDDDIEAIKQEIEVVI